MVTAIEWRARIGADTKLAVLAFQAKREPKVMNCVSLTSFNIFSS
jgi:hypothetical protein